MGSAIVDVSVHKITQSGIFTNDNYFLRRLAFVETRDGMDADTYRDGYNGGIWQLDESKYQATVQAARSNSLTVEFQGIYDSFGIVWKNTQWYDLRIPFFSALGARLYLGLIDSPIPFSFNISGQGVYWFDEYTSSNGSVQEFISSVNEYTMCIQEG